MRVYSGYSGPGALWGSSGSCQGSSGDPQETGDGLAGSRAPARGTSACTQGTRRTQQLNPLVQTRLRCTGSVWLCFWAAQGLASAVSIMGTLSSRGGSREHHPLACNGPRVLGSNRPRPSCRNPGLSHSGGSWGAALISSTAHNAAAVLGACSSNSVWDKARSPKSCSPRAAPEPCCIPSPPPRQLRPIHTAPQPVSHPCVTYHSAQGHHGAETRASPSSQPLWGACTCPESTQPPQRPQS